MSDLTRGELNDLLAGFAAKNPAYRDALKKDAKDVIERQMNSSLPETIKVSVVEDTSDTIHIVLPHVPAEGEELSDSDLESVAGGFLDDKYYCNNARQGAFATHVEVSIV